MPLPPSPEYRVIGPPGSGKTTHVAKRAAKAVKAGKKVLVCTLTKAAAAAVPHLDCQVGTLHSFCFQALNQPPLTEDHLDDFKALYPQYHWPDRNNDRRKAAATNGPRLLDAYHLRLRDPNAKPPSSVEAQFAERYEKWKEKEWPAANPAAAGPLMDFTDLILNCLEYVPQAPGKPDIILADEAQDLDPLELALLRKWGQEAGRLELVGDPQQNLYFWRGAQPAAFAQGKLPRGHVRCLAKSHRLPPAIQKTANAWYHPRTTDNCPTNPSVRNAELTLDRPYQIIPLAQSHTAKGQQVMLLASCAYMLGKLINRLRSEGVPFHNPYRPDNLVWNPLQDHAGNGWAIRRLANFLGTRYSRPNTPKQLESWLDHLNKSGILKPGGRKHLELLLTEQPDTPLSPEDLVSVFAKSTAIALAKGDLDWYRDRLPHYAKPAAEYPLKVAAKHGRAALLSPPSLTIGTVHSVKGGEADVVFLFPDISPAGNQDWAAGGERQASVRRLFYVGMTRARETLYLCDPSEDSYYIDFPGKARPNDAEEDFY